MRFYADLHIHSKHSRATSRDCDLEHLAWWAQRKGISVVATGDFTHPAWWQELNDKLVPAEPGLYRLRPEIEREVAATLPPACRGPLRFLLEVEISTIYKRGDKTRKVHHLIYAAEMATAARFRERLAKIGNIASDGRPILGLDSRHLLETTLESGDDAYLVPAHIWTPWFSALGSKSGFDAIEDCYGELAEHIFAVETGLSSDPPMNWRVSALDRFTLVSNSDAHSPPMLGREACVFDVELDYYALRRALETGEGYAGTVELFPEEGKYHLDGHRACGVCLEPRETRRHDGRCPVCGKPVTVGVLHRVETLADRAEGERPTRVDPFRSLVPLPEIVSELVGVGPKSKTVARTLASLADRLGPELELLERLPLEDVARVADPLMAEALRRLRAGEVRRAGGYDGKYGKIHLFEERELSSQLALFAPSGEKGGTSKGGLGEKGGTSKSSSQEVVREKGGTSKGARREKGGTSKSSSKRVDSFSGEKGGTSKNAPPSSDEVVFALGEKGGTSRKDAAATILGRLDPEQRAAARARGPLLIVAGPGTGKTFTLTHRLALQVAGGADPESCLAITFTRRAAEEMRQRLAELLPDAARVPVFTFHGLGYAILREQRERLGFVDDVRIADERAQRGVVGELFGLAPRDLRRRLDDFAAARRRGDPADKLDGDLARELERYRAAMRARGLVDFDDLLALPVAILAADDALRDAYRARWRRLAIDEYQDVDSLQYRLVRLLAPAAGEVCAIGDPDQSIYGFRGADVGCFLRFRDDFPGARVIELGRNYRSRRPIVDAARQAIAPASLVPGRRLEAMAGDGERIVLHQAASARAEADFVARTIEELLGGASHYAVDSGRVRHEQALRDVELSFGDFAVLYRTRAQGRPFAEALARAGLPCQERSHQRLLERDDVRLLLHELERSAPAAPTPLRARLDALRERGVGGLEPAELDAAHELLAPLAERCGDDPDDFRARLALGAEVDLWDPRAERISLLTLHAAKGLEFPVVFLAGCDDGLLPLTWSGARDGDGCDPAEERRLFFVGITRARERLFLTRAHHRAFHGEPRLTRPSPFLAAIGPALLRRRDAGRPPRARQLRLL